MKIRYTVLVLTLIATLTNQILGAGDELVVPKKHPASHVTNLHQKKDKLESDFARLSSALPRLEGCLDFRDGVAAMDCYSDLAYINYQLFEIETDDAKKIGYLTSAGELYLKAGVLSNGKNATLNRNIDVVGDVLTEFINTSYHARAVAEAIAHLWKRAPGDKKERTTYQQFTEDTNRTHAGLKSRLDKLADRIESFHKKNDFDESVKRKKLESDLTRFSSDLPCLEGCLDFENGVAAIDCFTRLADINYELSEIETNEAKKIYHLTSAGEFYLKAFVLSDGKNADLNNKMYDVGNFLIELSKRKGSCHARAVGVVIASFYMLAEHRKTSYQIFTEDTTRRTHVVLKGRLNELAGTIKSLTRTRETNQKISK